MPPSLLFPLGSDSDPSQMSHLLPCSVSKWWIALVFMLEVQLLQLQYRLTQDWSYLPYNSAALPHLSPPWLLFLGHCPFQTPPWTSSWIRDPEKWPHPIFHSPLWFCTSLYTLKSSWYLLSAVCCLLYISLRIKMSEVMWRSKGSMEDKLIVTYFSPDRMSIKSARGDIALFNDSCTFLPPFSALGPT